MKRGWLFSFEGLDGVGKTTQIQRCREWLETSGRSVVVVREPGGTVLGEAVRNFLLEGPQAISAHAEVLLFAAARAELVAAVIRPHLTAGGVVLADRYIDSSIAYQGYGRGLSVPWVRQLNQTVSEGAEPDATIWLDGPSRPGLEPPDAIEQRDARFFTRVAQGYTEIWEQEPERVFRVDASPPIDVVFELVQQYLARWLTA